MQDSDIKFLVDRHGGNFDPEEFLEGRTNLPEELFIQATMFRNWHGFSTLISSAWRPEGAHQIGALDQILYMDWKKTQPDPKQIWNLANTWPWWGVGLYFDWKHDELENLIGIHVDIVRPSKRGRPLRWLRVKGNYYYQNPRDGIFRYQGMKNVKKKYTLDEAIKQWKERVKP